MNNAQSGGSRRKLVYIPIIHTAADMGTLGASVRGMKLSALGRQGLTRNAAVVEKMWDQIESVVANLPVTAGYHAGLSGRIAGLRARAGDCVGAGCSGEPKPRVAPGTPGTWRDTDGYRVARTAGGRIPACGRGIRCRGRGPDRDPPETIARHAAGEARPLHRGRASTGPWAPGKAESCSWGCSTRSPDTWIPIST